MKLDASDYGEGASLMRSTSRKRAQRTDNMQEAAVQANAGADDAVGLPSRTTDAGTPFLADGISPGVPLDSHADRILADCKLLPLTKYYGCTACVCL